jgi:trans-aconitate methyltransferase
MNKRALFDKAYYDRFYGRKNHQAADRRADERIGELVCAYLKYLEQPVRRVVDLGCGLGVFRAAIEQNFPKASYTGVEISEYLCQEYGWTQGSVIDFRASKPFDLVICKDTLQYLAPKQAELALENLARLCRGALYLHVLTTEDWDELCDQSRTDDRVYFRSANWYRNRLKRHFTNIGAGLFLSEQSPAMPWAMEKSSR